MKVVHLINKRKTLCGRTIPELKGTLLTTTPSHVTCLLCKEKIVKSMP